MHRQIADMIPLFFFSVFFSSLTTGFGVDPHVTAGEDSNPYTPKAYLIRYWNKHIQNNLPQPNFLLSKASPLSAVESATFAKLAADHAISTHLPQFCSSARLLCFPDVVQSLGKHANVDFTAYEDKNFTNYGTNKGGGLESFKNYSVSGNLPKVDTFLRYSRGGAGHNDSFTNYASDGNVINQKFNTYGTGTAGGSGEFQTYADSVNNPNLEFTSYSSKGVGRSQDFRSYSVNANAGDQGFANYGKSGLGLPTKFSSYGTNANVIVSTFSSYDKSGTNANTTFKDYGVHQNVPEDNFTSYGEGGVTAVASFSNYRDQANIGDDSFVSYLKNSKTAEANFENYGNSTNAEPDKFTGYGESSNGTKVDFKEYGQNTTFKEYAKEGVTFSAYTNMSSMKTSSMAEISGSSVKRGVEAGKFFRESMLKEGTVMPMPDIRDRMPKRSFLPRSILSKLPFSTSEVSDLKQIFNIQDHSTMDKLVSDSLRECERAPSPGETKRCVGSIEDMIDFATSVLDRNIAVLTTQNVNGSKKEVMVGLVTGIDGGRVTKSVSCHQSLFPYLLYYCHSVPKVRVYEADLLDPITKSKINHGVAICHIDTSSWSAGHGAFLSLGSGPGRIEVCHWIFENDMIWTIAD